MRRERRSASCWICAAVPGRRLHQSPDMRQERESAKLAREQLVPAVGQRARRKPMGQPARLVSMVVLKALAQQVPVSTQSVRLTMRPALVQTQPVRCLQTLHMPGKIVPAYQLYFRSGRSTPSCASLPQIGLIAIASMLLFSITPQPAPTCLTFFEREMGSGASPGVSAKPGWSVWLVVWKTGSAWRRSGRSPSGSGTST